MAILGMGTDIVQISRILTAMDMQQRFAKRILTDTELELFNQLKQPERYLAKRWAAKEAAAKAFGLGIGRGLSFHHFEVSNDEMGAPIMQLSGYAQELADKKGINKLWLSISDEQDFATATLILES